MSFADTKTQSNFKKSQFLRLDVGEHTVRILDESAYAIDTHFIRSRAGVATVKCLGEDCPVCAVNKTLMIEHPSNYRNAQGYSAQVRKHSFNVFDKTLAKTCPKCQTVTKPRNDTFPSTCPECGSFISDIKATPVNKVVLLTVSDTIAKDLNRISKVFKDEKGEPISLNTFDVTFSVETGSGNKKETTVIGQPLQNAPIEGELELFDPATATMVFTREEIIEFMRGVSIRDIFLARKDSNESAPSVGATPKEEKVVADLSKEALDTISKLYG